MEKNIFENAKFGDKFRTRDGRMMLYLRQMPDNSDFHEVLDSDINIEHFHSNGQYSENYPFPCDIVSEWQESINEEELDRLAMNEIDRMALTNEEITATKLYKAGYRKAKEE